MSWWMLIVVLGLLKLPIAGLMLWIPFHNDHTGEVAGAQENGESGASEDEGGSMALPSSPLDPHPQSPRPRPRTRGPQGCGPRPPSPARVRRPARARALRTRMAPATAPSRSRTR
jgi:hypothetical protein